MIVLSFFMSGCISGASYERGVLEHPEMYKSRMAGTYLSKQTQIANEDLQLKTLYRKCIEDNYGNGGQIKAVCEPILEPLRISASVNQPTTAQP